MSVVLKVMVSLTISPFCVSNQATILAVGAMSVVTVTGTAVVFPGYILLDKSLPLPIT